MDISTKLSISWQHPDVPRINPRVLTLNLERRVWGFRIKHEMIVTMWAILVATHGQLNLSGVTDLTCLRIHPCSCGRLSCTSCRRKSFPWYEEVDGFLAQHGSLHSQTIFDLCCVSKSCERT